MNHATSQIKFQIINAFKDGNSITQLVKLYGYHRNSISNWIKASKKDPFFEKKRKVGSGRKPIFSGKNAKKILNLLYKPASRYGFETDLWTTNRIKKVCETKLGLKVSRMTLFRTLKKYEQSYKKPEKQFYEASLEKQSEWTQKVLPKIKSIIHKKHAILYFEDECSIQLTPSVGKTWGPIGKRLKLKVTGRKGSVSAISALSASGELVFNLHGNSKRFRAGDIIHFLSQIDNHHPDRHVVVIMDQASCHTSAEVKKYVLKNKKMNVFYLPPRSPEFNPTEKLWNHLKHNELKAHQAKTPEELESLTRKKMVGIAKNKKKLGKIFRRCEKADLYLN